VRRRYIQQPDGSLLEVPADWQQSRTWETPLFVSDAWMDGTRSPIDGSDIGSRTKLREHMRIHNVAHYDEIAPDIAAARRQRIDEFKRSRREDMRGAIERLRSGYRPRVAKED
jgi:hypothetical protein